ncbi:hypothetical protein, partial [Streptococcus pneumoniae]|uniref:hypothetical protein n=1 Tax=Streptococcus pneumoniae TaxID=1313 RepID=UPI001D042533
IPLFYVCYISILLFPTKEHLANTEKKLTEVEGKNNELEVFIEKKLEKRDQLLLENIRDMQAQNQKQKRKGFFGLFKK